MSSLCKKRLNFHLNYLFLSFTMLYIVTLFNTNSINIHNIFLVNNECGSISLIPMYASFITFSLEIRMFTLGISTVMSLNWSPIVLSIFKYLYWQFRNIKCFIYDSFNYLGTL